MLQYNYNKELLNRYGRIELSRNYLLSMPPNELQALFSVFFPMWIMPTGKNDGTDQVFAYAGRSLFFREIGETEEAPYYDILRTKNGDNVTYSFREQQSDKQDKPEQARGNEKLEPLFMELLFQKEEVEKKLCYYEGTEYKDGTAEWLKKLEITQKKDNDETDTRSQSETEANQHGVSSTGAQADSGNNDNAPNS